MSDIKESLDKLQKVADDLGQKVNKDAMNIATIEELQTSLQEVQEHVEGLKQNIELNNSSPLKYVSA